MYALLLTNTDDRMLVIDVAYCTYVFMCISTIVSYPLGQVNYNERLGQEVWQGVVASYR